MSEDPIRTIRLRLAGFEHRIGRLEELTFALRESSERLGTHQVVTLRALSPNASWWTDPRIFRENLIDQFWTYLAQLLGRVQRLLEARDRSEDTPPLLEV